MVVHGRLLKWPVTKQAYVKWRLAGELLPGFYKVCAGDELRIPLKQTSVKSNVFLKPILRMENIYFNNT